MTSKRKVLLKFEVKQLKKNNPSTVTIAFDNTGFMLNSPRTQSKKMNTFFFTSKFAAEIAIIPYNN